MMLLLFPVVVLLLVSGAADRVLPFMIVGATSNKLLSVILRRCNSAKEVC